MAHYSIWIPNASGDPTAALQSVGMEGLAQAGDLAPSSSVAIGGQGGPTSDGGLLLQWLDATAKPDCQARLGYHPQHQDWSPLPAFKLDGVQKPKGTVWIGFEKDRPVTPADLLRKGPYPGQANYLGESLVLGDKNVWQFPNQMLLPMEFAIDPDTGEDQKVVVQSEQPVWERMQHAFEVSKASFLKRQSQFWGELPEANRVGLEAPQTPPDAPQWTEYQIQDYCIWALSLNYRLTKLIAVGLRLFRDGNLWLALYETTDVAKIVTLQIALKKTELAWEIWRQGMSESPGSSGGVAA